MDIFENTIPTIIGTLLSPAIIGAFGILVFSVLMVFILRGLARKRFRIKTAFEKEVLLVLVAKEALEAEEERKTPSNQDIQEDIAVAETLMSAIGGMPAERGFKKWFYGMENEISFEIVAHQGLISFYVVVPKRLREFAEQQIHAQYSSAQIEQVSDYNLFAPQGAVVGSYLTFRRPAGFPLKTYKKMDGDPLSALTNAMSKIGPDEGVAIQYVVRSAPKGWRSRGLKIARAMQQGKRSSEAVKGTTFLGALAAKQKPKAKPGEPQKEYKLSPLEEELVKGIEEKASKAGLEANIRIVSSAPERARADAALANILNAFNQYNIYEYGNSFTRAGERTSTLVEEFIYRYFDEKRRVLVNTEELASLYHFPIPSIETPNIRWLAARKAPAPQNIPKEGLILGKNIYRGEETMIRLKREDRRRHVYVIGRSGSGKSVLIANMAIQDIRNGEGVCVVDPHGDLIEAVLAGIPKERADDVIIFDPSDTERPVGLNMLEVRREEDKDFAVQEMIAIFYKLFPPEMIGPMFEHNMRNVMLTLMSDPKESGTIAEIPRMFSDADYQKKWVAKVTDPVVRAFWEKEMAKTSDFHKSEMLGYLISKVGKFVENSMMRNIIGQSQSGFDIREVMDQKKILLVNLSKGKTGEVNSNLLGLIIVSKLQMAALGRADLPEEKRHDFYLYIDEFQNFITDSIATILSEARKYRLDLTIAHQYMGQLVPKGDTQIRDAVLGNVGSMIVYRIGIEDAELLAKEFAPTFNAYDLVNVERFTAYAKVLIDNTASKPFTMAGLPPEAGGDPKLVASLKQLSRLKFGRPRALVEAEILERAELGASAAPPPPSMEPRL